tara:strand:+ start:126 stop:2012 length:1887 start_codon:yes stop_codon:yes gene_type:complete
MGETKVNNNMIQDGAIDTNKLAPNSISSANITDGSIVNADISPSAAITLSKISTPGSATDFLKGDGSFGTVDTSAIATNTFNIGVLGFKMAVNDGLTIYNLIDGVVDEFHDESGVDTAENSATTNYDSSGDFYQNLDSTPGVTMHLGVEAVTFENPEHAPLITYTSQEAANGAFGAQGSITFPSLTTSIEATMVGAGGANSGNGDGGPGGSVQATITNPSIAGATWDYVVGEGGNGTSYATPSPEVGASGGYGGGGSGSTGGGGGFTGIFDGEVTIIEGGTYNENGAWQTPGSPNNYPDEGPGFADTVSPTNASEAVLIVGSGGAGENSNGAPQAQGGGGGFLAGTNGSGSFSVPTAGSGGTNASGGGADQEANGHLAAYPFGEGTGFGPSEWTQESPHPNAIHFQGGGTAYPPYHYGGAGSGYHGGGGTSDPGGTTGGAGGGAGYSNPTYVPTPSLEYETAVGAGAAPAPESTFDEAPYYTALPSPRQALFAAGAQGEGAENGASNQGGDGGILLTFDAGAQATSMTLVSDTFTANSTPTTSRIVVFAELPDGLSDFTVSVTRDNSTFDTVTLTDTGYVAGSSGTKIFTGTRTLTGTASPQVQMRWKVVGSSLSGTNKIHGVALQWA